jgi:hypothetical protein
MSHEIGRTPQAGLTTAAATVAVTATTLKASGAALNALARYRVRRWLTQSAPAHCVDALQFADRLKKAVQSASMHLAPDRAVELCKAAITASAEIAEKYSVERFREWVGSSLVENPFDGVLGASERMLRQLTLPLLILIQGFEELPGQTSTQALRTLRAEIIRAGLETVKLDVTPRPGLNLDRQARHRTWTFVACVLGLVLATIFLMVIRTDGIIGGVGYIFHSLASLFRGPHH